MSYIYGTYSLQRWCSWKKCVIQSDFLHQEQVIMAISSQRSHFTLEFFLKQKSTGVSNSIGIARRYSSYAFSTYPLLVHAYLNIFWNLGDENWWCVNDCNFKILFLLWRSKARSNNIIVSEKYLIKFFHNRNPYTSNGCIFPVVPAGIVRKTISVAESGLVSEIMLGQCPLHESNNNTDCGPTFGRNTSFSQVFTWFDVNFYNTPFIVI